MDCAAEWIALGAWDPSHQDILLLINMAPMRKAFQLLASKVRPPDGLHGERIDTCERIVLSRLGLIAEFDSPEATCPAARHNFV